MFEQILPKHYREWTCLFCLGLINSRSLQHQVAALFGVSPSTNLKAKFHNHRCQRQAKKWCRKKTTPHEGSFSSGLWFSTQTTQSRLHTGTLGSHRAARWPAMTALQPQAHLRCYQQHVHWNLRNIEFSNDSRVCLRQLDHKVRVWRTCGLVCVTFYLSKSASLTEPPPAILISIHSFILFYLFNAGL